ncbi:MAG: trypsin-like peptidase domain-containing protein [Gemmiger sp.]|uniref:S1C family serine protease n=1 Tax=Gemmiger sp. TaxID=2049027 RepID=UPI002E75D7A7|nr:trypsin-like peptidase domain-containing protein [Gemmiger sp.]MEE0800060.1 trypsin-like peptidase domain-containing protein [Gemmiger sp.]
MSEYDYSGLYQNGPQNHNDQNGQNGQTAGQPQANTAPQASQNEGGYPNVGSSGANTANTARTDYSGVPGDAQAASGSSANAGAAPQQTGTVHNYNGYSYSSAPQQPQEPPRKKKGNAKKVLLRVVAGVGVVVLGFGGGLAGTVVASRTGLMGNQVVVQTVDRSGEADSVNQGSASGSTLSIQDVAAIVQPSVVAITTEQMVSSNIWFGSYVQSGAGSGVVISQDGYILTCAHVVEGASNIKVQMSDNTEYTATLVGSDSTSDIAVIKVEATGLTPAVIGDSDKLAVGEVSIAVGNPLGTLGGTVTDGIISAVNRQVQVENNDMNLIQTSASINPGNSGGGLFNANGELIGIVNAKSGADEAEGLGFAIPINSAMSTAKELIENGYVKRPVLGITVREITDATTAMQYGVSNYGVYIFQVSTGSGAEKAGLKAGDRIVSIDDVAVSSSSDVIQYCQSKQVGDTVTLQIERDGKIASYQVVLGESTQTQ